MTTLIKRSFGKVRDLAAGVRDWRIRLLLPVILINVVVFLGLFALMQHFGEKNLVTARKFGGIILLDELERAFVTQMLAHRAEQLRSEVATLADTHDIQALTVYNALGEPMLNGGQKPGRSEIAQAAELLFEPGSRSRWAFTEDRSGLILGRYIENAPQCQTCHSALFPRLGVIQLTLDLTAPAAAATRRINWNFAVAAVVWSGLLGLMFWAGGRTIGRPIADMEKSIRASGGELRTNHDLQSLAERVRRTLEMVELQTLREAEMSRRMVRAEQLAALGEMAAGLTHEIKNPLAGVIAALELLCNEEELGSEKHGLYEQMIHELRRVTDTLTSLLRLAKPRPLRRAEVDLRRIVQEVTTLFAARLRRNGVEFQVKIDEQVPRMRLDPGLMTQLIVNLLTNGLQATSSGGLVHVSLEAFPGRDGAILEVSDSGVGIPADHLERIFEPFFTTKENGTGLGMAICRQIVEQHRGTINVESEPGIGTRVTILLAQGEELSNEEDNAIAAGG